MAKVSVIVPNYNHAPYLNWRIDTVLRQTYRDLEVVILDDASTDNSRDVIEPYRSWSPVKIHYNAENSGSVFRQWEKGMSLASGEYLWVAESDDWADPRFLERLVPMLDAHPLVGFAYAQSWIVNREFKVTGHASCWTDDLDASRWRRNFVADGRDEIRRFLLVKNTVPNASAVLMRRSVVERVRPIIASFRLCGDWMHWIRMLSEADIAFVAEDLNFWRLESSNARTAPPGVLEWQEGQQVLSRACELLHVDETEQGRVLLAFQRRCSQWLTDFRKRNGTS